MLDEIEQNEDSDEDDGSICGYARFKVYVVDDVFDPDSKSTGQGYAVVNVMTGVREFACPRLFMAMRNARFCELELRAIEKIYEDAAEDADDGEGLWLEPAGNPKKPN